VKIIKTSVKVCRSYKKNVVRTFMLVFFALTKYIDKVKRKEGDNAMMALDLQELWKKIFG